MSNIDVLGASSKGYQKIMRDCKKSAEEMALECRDVNLDAQRAIVCAKEIAERESTRPHSHREFLGRDCFLQ